MFGHGHYVPVLKWKQGEYQALHRLADGAKAGLTPLIEIPAVGFDHEAGEDRESIDSHLGDFGRRLKAKWGSRLCFVDAKYIDSDTRMADGGHYVEAIFHAVRAEGCRAVPVVALGSDSQYLAAAASVVRTDRNGVCLRLVMADFDRRDLAADITGLLTALQVGYADADLVVDFGAPNLVPISAFTRTVPAVMEMIPMLNRWRTFTVAATSYPTSIASVPRRFGTLPRHERVAYRDLVARLPSEARISLLRRLRRRPSELLDLDMRLIKPFAKLRYTINDEWHVGRGDTVRTHGFGQYRQLCEDVRAQPYFDGASFSAETPTSLTAPPAGSPPAISRPGCGSQRIAT